MRHIFIGLPYALMFNSLLRKERLLAQIGPSTRYYLLVVLTKNIIWKRRGKGSENATINVMRRVLTDSLSRKPQAKILVSYFSRKFYLQNIRKARKKTLVRQL